MKIVSFWFNRFEVSEISDNFLFKDKIFNNHKVIKKSIFDKYSDNEKLIRFFQKGFLNATLFECPHQQFFQILLNKNILDWQFPCVTERISYDEHSAVVEPFLEAKNLHVYLALPWAPLIDLGLPELRYLSLLKINISGLIGALFSMNVVFKIHTVCQHIFWERCIPIWKEIGVTDVWLSHMPSYVDPDLPFNIHPWALYAVNVEDPNRREGLEIGKDPASKSLLASFIGAHAEGYISDVRLKLRQFSEEPGFLIRVTDKWHFEDVVYKHQVQGLPLEENYVIDDSVRGYNAVLSDSVFALCPSGAGPNSIRLWEALAVGSIPVLLGKFPVLPRGGSLPEIDWDSIVLKVSDDQLSQLPQILRAMPMDEIRTRQQRGMEAYALVREQRCF
jgi:hypothetical protein